MVVVIVTAAAKVVVVISSNLFHCMFCGGTCGVGSGSGVNTYGGCSSLAHDFHHYHHHTTTTTITTSCTTIFTTQHTLNYGTFGNGGGSDIGWVVMVVVGMVRYWWCW